jgi:hypothetical protein
MEKIFSHFNFKEYPTLSKVLGYLDDNPSGLEINSNRKQLALDEAVAKRIDEFYTIKNRIKYKYHELKTIINYFIWINSLPKKIIYL